MHRPPGAFTCAPCTPVFSLCLLRPRGPADSPCAGAVTAQRLWDRGGGRLTRGRQWGVSSRAACRCRHCLRRRCPRRRTRGPCPRDLISKTSPCFKAIIYLAQEVEDPCQSSGRCRHAEPRGQQPRAAAAAWRVPNLGCMPAAARAAALTPGPPRACAPASPPLFQAHADAPSPRGRHPGSRSRSSMARGRRSGHSGRRSCRKACSLTSCQSTSR
jgi:hypothetical protein